MKTIIQGIIFLIVGIIFLAGAVYFYLLAFDTLTFALTGVLALCGVVNIFCGVKLIQIRRRK